MPYRAGFHPNKYFIAILLLAKYFLHLYSSEELSLLNVTKGHLVAYDPERDFLPMVLAHCDYSLKVGEGGEETVVKFNWKYLERQLVDRFIRGKPRITSLVSSLNFFLLSMLYRKGYK